MGLVTPIHREPTGPVLLFDGECGLCNRVVRQLLKFDRRGRLKFAALQSPSGQGYLRLQGLPTADFSTLVYVPEWGTRSRYRPEFKLRTDGVVAALRACGGWGVVFGGALALVPRPLRDAAYKGVARVRLRLFGDWKGCPLPNPVWAARFFD